MATYKKRPVQSCNPVTKSTACPPITPKVFMLGLAWKLMS